MTLNSHFYTDYPQLAIITNNKELAHILTCGIISLVAVICYKKIWVYSQKISLNFS